MKILAIVPARSGSKGFPHKNIKKIQGKTLLEWAVAIGKSNSHVVETLISTDSQEYEDLGKQAGALSLGLRSAELASDKAKSIDVVIDIINKVNFDFDHILLLQPTSPCRSSENLSQMIEQMKSEIPPALVSVSPVEEPHPYKMKIIENGELKPLFPQASSEIPRQMLPPVYQLNGAFYLIKKEVLMTSSSFFPNGTRAFHMDAGVNIDSEEDFSYLNYLIENNQLNFFSTNDAN